jgi:hypothetical protein
MLSEINKRKRAGSDESDPYLGDVDTETEYLTESEYDSEDTVPYDIVLPPRPAGYRDPSRVLLPGTVHTLLPYTIGKELGPDIQRLVLECFKGGCPYKNDHMDRSPDYMRDLYFSEAMALLPLRLKPGRVEHGGMGVHDWQRDPSLVWVLHPQYGDHYPQFGDHEQAFLQFACLNPPKTNSADRGCIGWRRWMLVPSNVPLQLWFNVVEPDELEDRFSQYGRNNPATGLPAVGFRGCGWKNLQFNVYSGYSCFHDRNTLQYMQHAMEYGIEIEGMDDGYPSDAELLYL